MASERKPKPRKPLVVQAEPNTCSIVGWNSLSEVAWKFFKDTGIPVSVQQIAGAARALNVKGDVKMYRAHIRGAMVYRQQTMIHPHHLEKIHEYIVGKMDNTKKDTK